MARHTRDVIDELQTTVPDCDCTRKIFLVERVFGTSFSALLVLCVAPQAVVPLSFGAVRDSRGWENPTAR